MWMMCRLQGGRERHLDRAWVDGKSLGGGRGLRQPAGAVQCDRAARLGAEGKGGHCRLLGEEDAMNTGQPASSSGCSQACHLCLYVPFMARCLPIPLAEEPHPLCYPPNLPFHIRPTPNRLVLPPEAPLKPLSPPLSPTSGFQGLSSSLCSPPCPSLCSPPKSLPWCFPAVLGPAG